MAATMDELVLAELPPSAQPGTIVSSRKSRAAAGWEDCAEKASVAHLLPGGKVRSFSWIDPRPLLISRNDRVARAFADPTNEERRRWVEAQLARPENEVPRDLTVRRFADRDRLSFLCLGDTGEGDVSQYTVIEPMQACSQGIDFVLIASDVIYPAGDINEYDEKFYYAYKDFPGPVYAIPGNHDWYDGLQGFMHHFCGAKPELRPPARPVGATLRRLLRRATWRNASKPDRARLEAMRKRRAREGQLSGQPGPYFAVDAGSLLIVGIDTGITNSLDEAQGRWLREMSRIDKAKLLITGKPFYVNGEEHDTPIEGGGSVLPIVNERAHRYAAVIGGDVHNFERYPIHLKDGRVIQHLVNGAAGAYTHATHKIPKPDFKHGTCTEEEFRCYPRRGDSLAAYSRLYAKRFHLPKSWIVPYKQAPLIVAQRLRGDAPKRPEDRDEEITPRALRAARRVYPLPGKGKGTFHSLMSEILDWNEPPPPLFKSFLRVDAWDGHIDIRCFAATGCAEHAHNPPLEDWITGVEQPDGTWKWDVHLD
jgi:hypothetical protein